MWTRKQLKREGKAALKGNYWRSVLVCVLLMIFAGAYAATASNAPRVDVATPATDPRSVSNSDIVNFVVRSYTGATSFSINGEPAVRLDATNATKGVASAVFDNFTKSGSFIFGILNAVNQFAFGDRIFSGVIIVVGAALGFLYWMFVGNLLRVGECRYFLENRYYQDTPATRLLFLYRVGKVWRPARIMLYRTLYVLLWSLTIVGGVIKSYTYRMVPYILAENPQVTRKQAFRLSKQMMRGYKWSVFKLDLSFWGWEVLSGLTFGLLGFFYVNPYTAGTHAELYLILREKALSSGFQDAAVLNDGYLVPADGQAVDEQYPTGRYTIPVKGDKKWIPTDYHRKYSLRNLVLMFFAFCAIGWVWEVCVDLFGKGVFTNRGTLWGPWLPLYGTGGVLILLLTKRWIDKPLVTMGLVVAICGVVEYFTGMALEHLMGVRYWNYDGYFLNIHGRVCLEGLLVFGIVGTLGIYVLAPALDDLFNKLPSKVKTSLCIVLVTAFLGDLAISAFYPNSGENITFPLSGEESIPESLRTGG